MRDFPKMEKSSAWRKCTRWPPNIRLDPYKSCGNWSIIYTKSDCEKFPDRQIPNRHHCDKYFGHFVGRTPDKLDQRAAIK